MPGVARAVLLDRLANFETARMIGSRVAAYLASHKIAKTRSASGGCVATCRDTTNATRTIHSYPRRIINLEQLLRLQRRAVRVRIINTRRRGEDRRRRI